MWKKFMMTLSRFSWRWFIFMSIWLNVFEQCFFWSSSKSSWLKWKAFNETFWAIQLFGAFLLMIQDHILVSVNFLSWTLNCLSSVQIILNRTWFSSLISKIGLCFSNVDFVDEKKIENKMWKESCKIWFYININFSLHNNPDKCHQAIKVEMRKDYPAWENTFDF